MKLPRAYRRMLRRGLRRYAAALRYSRVGLRAFVLPMGGGIMVYVSGRYRVTSALWREDVASALRAFVHLQYGA